MCDCHNSEAEHEVWLAEQAAYWRAYFAVGTPAFKNFGPLLSPEEMERIQREEK